MVKYGLPALIVVMGILYIFVIPDEPQAVKILFKLIPMWLIIAYGYLHMPSNRQSCHWMTGIGLFFCMLGDGLLVWFTVGLFAFLIGHLFYVTAFISRWRFSAIRFFMLIPILAYASFMSWHLIQALLRADNYVLAASVLLYIIVISFMAWSAIMTGNKLAMAGSLLFAVSDSILAWDRFVSDVVFAGPLIMITYYTAQFLIASSLRTIGQDERTAAIYTAGRA
ncbi:lysoplasmalogenase [Paenibacillus melissococcoides]|uniref:Lysoplasmalogenase n=1 Tax=Paenibacillus melissococcoides TaxID=2912268 RepID=A0ABN8UH02_9BACL|nr:lysoplasmalogenase [Bacillus cereus]CAH8249653.1 lysoplasmalogenase [Paenibacillus melissococcoides]CAH8721469.1 lysoplasmalogenase [Paenibacillus melissococcoides]CAH8721750.1 lysoplasmalogenase [Paenibacillus melissococcoides]